MAQERDASRKTESLQRLAAAAPSSPRKRDDVGGEGSLGIIAKQDLQAAAWCSLMFAAESFSILEGEWLLVHFT